VKRVMVKISVLEVIRVVKVSHTLSQDLVGKKPSRDMLSKNWMSSEAAFILGEISIHVHVTHRKQVGTELFTIRRRSGFLAHSVC
jgi:hypothetical protein